MKKIDLVGARFGLLVVIREAKSRRYLKRDRSGFRTKAFWLCSCDCGEQIEAMADHLRTGHTKSCGCERRLALGRRTLKHGRCVDRQQTREWRIWSGLNARCANTGDPNYGGRGIHVCDAWRSSFEQFLADMGPCPDGYSIERIDVDGNYSPENCKWIPLPSQAINRRTTLWVEHGGRRMCLKEVAATEGIPYLRLYKQYRIYGKPIQEAIAHSRALQ